MAEQTMTPADVKKLLSAFISRERQTYIGMRYVPMVADPAEWSAATSYEPLTLVTDGASNTYISKFYVPEGIPLSDGDYWFLIGPFSQQVAALDALVRQLNAELADEVSERIDADNAIGSDVARLEIQDKKRVLAYETVADMQADTTIYEGAIAHTNGFNASGDGGAAYYIVGASGTANGMDVLALQGALFAHKVLNDDLSRIIEYNILDYEGATLDEKWTNMSADFLTWQNKHILIPYPREECEACIKVGNDWKWKVAAPILFDDSCNCAIVEVYGELYAIGNVEQVLLFDGAAKPENIYFTNGINIRGNRHDGNTIGAAIDVRAGARINFYGQTIINDCDKGVSIGGANQTAPAEAQFDMLQIGFFDNNAVYVSGSSYVTNFNCDYLSMSCAQNAQLNAFYIGDFTNNVHVGQAIYATDVAKDGYGTYDANSVVYIDGGTHDVHNVSIGFISATNGAYGLYVNGSASKIIYDIMVDLISLQVSGVAVYARYAQSMTIGRIKRDNVVDIANSYYSLLQSAMQSGDTVDRFAAYTTKFRVDTTTAIGSVPSIANTDRGTITEVSTAYGTKLYYNNGTENLPLDGQMFVPTVTAANLPAAAWYLMGKMYRIASTGTGVNDKILIGARINNANVWYDLIAGAVYTP